MHNNPVRYTDPTGHCDGDATDAGNPDAACWDEYRDVVSGLGLGYDVQGLDGWNLDALAGLNGWLKAGVKFTNVTNDTADMPHPGETWTAGMLAAARETLNTVKNRIGAGWKTALGLDGGTLTINSVNGGLGWRDDDPTNYKNNRINVVFTYGDALA